MIWPVNWLKSKEFSLLLRGKKKKEKKIEVDCQHRELYGDATEMTCVKNSVSSGSRGKRGDSL